MKIIDLLGIFHKRRIKLIRKETEETKRLCCAQKVLNDLMREEKEIRDAAN